MNTIVELPSNGKSYAKTAEIGSLTFSHFRHLAVFSSEEMPVHVRMEAALDVLSSVVKVDGLTTIKDLYGIDFDSLMVDLRLIELPDAHTFRFMWECSDPTHPLEVNTGAFVLGSLNRKKWDGKTFNVREYEFDFPTIQNWLDSYRLVSEKAQEMQATKQQEIEATLQQQSLDEDTYEAEKQRILDVRTRFERELYMLELRYAMHLKQGATLAAKKEILDNFPLKHRMQVGDVVKELSTYGIEKVLKQKCSKCGNEAHVSLPFLAMLKFL